MCDNFLSLIVIILSILSSSRQLSSANSCRHGLHNVLVTRVLTKKGFHRDLIINIEWTGEDHCNLLLQESMPSGLFVDIEQVKAHNKQFEIRSTSRVDVEAPAHKAVAQELWIYPSQQQYSHSLRKDHHSISITFPVHLRYHMATSSDFKLQTVSLGLQRIFAKCYRNTSQENCKVVQTWCSASGGGLCDWIEIEQELPDVSVTVPVGDVNHGPIVTIVTLLCTALGALYVLSVTLRY